MDIEMVDGKWKYVAKLGEEADDVEANAFPSPSGTEKEEKGKCFGLRLFIQLVRRQKLRFRILRMFAAYFWNVQRSMLERLLRAITRDRWGTRPSRNKISLKI